LDYFKRPIDSFIKLGVVMDGNSVTLQQMKDDYNFSHVISADKMARIHDDSKVAPKMANSVFEMVSN
jgi:hypothetical protein